VEVPTVLTTDDIIGTPRAVTTALDALDALRRDDRPGPGARAHPTGFRPLDEVLHGGVRAGDLTLLAGKPGQGKTTAALQWARNLAADGHSTVFACYEHDVVDLLTRLLLTELGHLAEARRCGDELRLETLREHLRSVATGETTLEDVLASDPLLVEAERRMRAYGERLLLVPASGTLTDVEALGRLVEARAARALFVDYLQKIPVTGGVVSETDRVTRVAEGLKDLALRRSVAVVAISAADHAGLVDRRLHLHHLRGSSALAYEADVAIVLNEKLGIVSRLHLAYDTTRAHDFRELVVFSIEKNRRGLADVHLEFRKDFANHRFDPEGRWVSERLWDAGSPEE
jgi:replicative DNA helicase